MSDLRAEFFDRVTDARAVPILARHAIPVIGVLLFGWSVLEVIAALLLDAVSTLWTVGAVGSYFAVKQFHHDTEDPIRNALHFWAGVLGTFLFIAGLLSIFVVVPASMMLPLLQGADLDPMELITSGWLPRAFALMLACQLPGLVQRIRSLQASGVAPEKMGMDAEVGFVVHRVIVLGMVSSFLAIFGAYALHALVIVAQAFGAGTEIMRDRYVTEIMGGSKPARPLARVESAARRARRRRKKR